MWAFIDACKQAFKARLPVISAAIRIGLRAEIVDRAAALALFCMLAAVPALFGAFSVVGFVLGAVDGVAGLAGYDVAHEPVVERLVRFVKEVLPGVTWDPTELAHSLVAHRTYNGVVGSVAALLLGLGVFARIDAAVRAVLGRRRRSAWRAAGMMTLVFLVLALLAAILVLAGPVLEWSARVTHLGVSRVSATGAEWLPLLLSTSQTLPISVGFFVMVRWSAGSGTIGKRNIALAAAVYGLLWFLGQRVFSLYVTEIAAMDAVYGTLTGVVALMLWLYYAAIAFLASVCLLAAWTGSSAHAAREADSLSTAQAQR